MKKFTAILAGAAMAGTCMAGVVDATGVMDDCALLFMGGQDLNGNGCFDDGEMPECLNGGTNALVRRAWDFPADCITWTNMDVSCNCRSNVLQNETCLYFHQKGTEGGSLVDKACALALPKFGFSESVVSNYQPYTMLVRVKLPAADTKADGTTYTGAGIWKSEVANDDYYGTIAAIGNDRTSGHYRGSDLRVSHSPSIPALGVVAQNWNSGTAWTVWDCTFTNASCKTRTRDAEWVEVAVRGYTWTWEKKPAPGVQIDAWWWNGSTSHGANGGRNGAPLGAADFLLGNHASGTAKSGFQGAIHAVAVWGRCLSDADCMNAFKYMANGTRTYSHDGNNSSLYKFGYDGSGAALFRGQTGGETTLTAPSRFATAFPSNFIAGTVLTLKTPLDKFTQGMKQVLRLRTAATSAAGVLRVKANGSVLAAGEGVLPGKTYLYYLPKTFFGGSELAVELEALSAEQGGIVFDTVEVGGSWTIGLKDKSTDNIVPGERSTAYSYLRTFVVGSNLMTDSPTYWYDHQINTVRSYTDIKFYVPEGMQEGYRYVFKGSVYGGSLDETYGAPHEYVLNGTKRSDRFFFVDTRDQKDYEMTIEPGELASGWNTLHWQNYVTNTMNGTKVKYWRYTYWDYVTLQIVKRTGAGSILIVK